MFNFDIFTDSSCDLPQEMIEQFDLHVVQLEVLIDDQPPVLNNQIDIKSFYDQLRAGANAKTSAATPGAFEDAMKKSLDSGKDIIYIGFSSGLSTTYNNGVMVMQELHEEYPERKLCYIDTLCASVGQGLLVYQAALLREQGVGIEEVQSKIEAMKDKIHHQVTADDLFFLKRGGRISTTTAIAGSILKFKPIIHVDMEGRLQNIGKVRGRKASLSELVSKMKANANLEEFGYVFISHSDCMDDVNLLIDLINKELKPTKIIVGDIGPVIGAHTGPGTIALCYLGTTQKGM